MWYLPSRGCVCANVNVNDGERWCFGSTAYDNKSLTATCYPTKIERKNASMPVAHFNRWRLCGYLQKAWRKIARHTFISFIRSYFADSENDASTNVRGKWQSQLRSIHLREEEKKNCHTMTGWRRVVSDCRQCLMLNVIVKAHSVRNFHNQWYVIGWEVGWHKRLSGRIYRIIICD